MLEPGAQLTLNVAFSPALRADHSYVSVIIYGVFVGNIPAKDTDRDTEATFDLPVREPLR